MMFIKVRWKHDAPDEPVLLYSELSDDLSETRKVEVFADGTMGFASRVEHTGTTQLSVEPLPSLADIASDPEFEPSEIEAREFEDVWARRLDRPRL